MAKNMERSWWHRHISLKLFWLQPMAPWSTGLALKYSMPRSPDIYLTAKENLGKPQLEYRLMKVLRPVIASNGVPYLQTRSIGSHSTSWREKGRKKKGGVVYPILNPFTRYRAPLRLRSENTRLHPGREFNFKYNEQAVAEKRGFSAWRFGNKLSSPNCKKLFLQNVKHAIFMKIPEESFKTMHRSLRFISY